MSNISYRPLAAADYPVYRELRLECLKLFPENFGATYEVEASAKELHAKKVMDKADDNDFVMGAFEDKLLIGICRCAIEKEISTGYQAKITQVYVSQSKWGKRVGQQLLREAMNKILNNAAIQQIALNVNSQNARAIKVYKNLGFIEYQKPEDDLNSSAKHTAESHFIYYRSYRQ